MKATGWGNNNSGDFFVRHRTGGFAVLPCAAYIWLNDLTTAVAYQNLLQANSYSVELIHMDDVATTLWSRYNLIVIGPETGDLAAWGTPAAVGALQQYATPILGLGEGGYAFFGKVGLDIGYPYGWHGVEAFTYAMDPATRRVAQPISDPPQPRADRAGLRQDRPRRHSSCATAARYASDRPRARRSDAL